MTREGKLAQALKDILGFSERNQKRAEMALQAAYIAKLEKEVIVQEARLHEAQRFFHVVRDRVAEALHDD